MMLIPVSAYYEMLVDSPTKERAVKVVQSMEDEIDGLLASAVARVQACRKISADYGFIYEDAFLDFLPQMFAKREEV